MNIAEHVAVDEKRPVLYLLQAFNAQTLFGQIASSRARVDWLDVAEGKLTAEETERFQAASRELGASSLKIDDMPHLEDAEIVERIESWAGDHPGGLAVVDHLERDTVSAVDRCSQALKSAAVRTGAAVFATAWHELVDDDQCAQRGAGVSHADFSWHLFRWWCSSSNLYPRDEVNLIIHDERTGEQRLSLDTRLDEKFRRFRVVGARSCCPSLREERTKHPSGMVYHRILKPGEEPPPGSRLVCLSGVDPELEITAWEGSWESSRWEV